MNKFEIDYYFDEDLGIRHIKKHDVHEHEIEEYFKSGVFPGLTEKRNDGSIIGYCWLKSNRFLTILFRVVGLRKYHVFTAYDINEKEDRNKIKDYYFDRGIYEEKK